MLQLHNLLLVSNTASTPKGIVLAVATKCHCSHSLKSHISMQIKGGLREDPLWLRGFRCRSLLGDILMSAQSATHHASSRGCFPSQVTDWELLGCNGEKGSQLLQGSTDTGYQVVSKNHLQHNMQHKKLELRYLRLVRNSSSHHLSVVTNCENISSLFQRKVTQVS